MIKLVKVLKKIENEDTKYDTLNSHSKAETIINESIIDSGQIIDSVIDYTIRTSKYNPFAGSSYIDLSKD